MRFWIPSLLFLPLASIAASPDNRCLVSFDSASLDVCSLELRPVHESLRHLGALDLDGGGYRIVKFDGPIRAHQRRALEAAGAKILGYAPHHAYLVQMDAAIEARARAVPGVLWTGPYLPIWKLDINLANDLVARRKSGDAAAGSIIQEAGITELTVALQPGVELGHARENVLGVTGLSYKHSEKGFDHERVVVAFEADQLVEAVQALALNPEVASISLRWQNELLNSQAGWLHQSGRQTPVAGSMPAFENGIFGCGQIVAAADSGLHAAHCSFADAAFGQPVTSVCSTGASCAPVTPNFNHRKIGAHYKWDGSTSGAPADGHGHGTHVMGTITGNNPANGGAVDCATRTSPGGLTDLDGTAPGAKLISQEMGASLQYLNGGGGTIYHAATVAYANGARIHNNSWGSSCRNSSGACISGCQVEYRQTTRDADAAVWDNPQLALLVAAGNSGGLGGSTGCGPGADVGAAGNAKNVFSIGSNLRGIAAAGMSSFSSRGPTSDRRLKPDLTAQGSSIISASRTTCGTTSMSGTSMATPTAAGLSALVREYLQRGFYPSGIENPAHAIPEPSAALIKAIMISGAFNMTGSGTTGGAPSQSQGWGRILLGDSLYFNGDARGLWLHDGSSGLQTGGESLHQLTVDAGEPLAITLVWHDAPALVNANPHGVNQLRLEVTAPNGAVWTQKLPAGGGLTNPNPVADTTTQNYDDRNNVHRIEFPTPVAGAYTVRVRGMQVAVGPQPFALAATGKLLGLTEPDFVLQASAAQSGICAGDPVAINVGAYSFEGFNDPVTLAHSSLPSGASGTFTVNPIVPAVPAAASVLNITNTSGVTAGPWTVDINASASGPGFPARSKTRSVTLQVDASAPPAANLASPANAAVGQPLRPTLSWDPIPGVTGYRVELARDAAFTDIVVNQVVTQTSLTPSSSLAANTPYYWRVTAANRCGNGQTSAVRSFTTANLLCSEPNLAIPDNNATGVTDIFNVSNTGTLTGLRLQLDIDHTYVGDLRMWLSKGGTEVQLLDRPGPNNCSGDNIKVTVDDSASLSLQTNCTPGSGSAYVEGESYRGMNPLAAFTGTSLDGAWSLRVSDHANIDTGRINRWCLLPVLSAPPVAVFSNGFED
jgi:subtilisin-like proprotein convertase family protein